MPDPIPEIVWCEVLALAYDHTAALAAVRLRQEYTPDQLRAAIDWLEA